MATDTELGAFQAQLAGLEREIVALGESDCSAEAYFDQFLEKLASVLGAGGAIWRVNEANELVIACQLRTSVAGLDEQGAQRELLGRALQRVVESRRAVVLPGRDGTTVYDGGLGEGVGNNSPHVLMFVPVVVAEALAAVVVLISPEGIDPRAVRGYLGFVTGLCARAGAFLQTKKIGRLQEELGRTDRFREYISALHSSLDPRRVCYALANYGQELLGVYRCMAGTFDSRGKFRLEAASGLETVAVKSSYIKGITVVARQVCRNEKPLLVDNPEAVTREDGMEGDDLVTAARLYMLQAGSLVLGVFPVRKDDRVVGALIVEKGVEEPIGELERRQIGGLLAEAGSALGNSLTYRRLPLSPLIRAVAAVRDRVYRMGWPRRLAWVAVLAVVLGGPFVVKMDVKVIGNAELAPTTAQIAYAQQDGIVEWVADLTNRRVEKGAVLAELDKRVIENEIDRVENAWQEARLALKQAQAREGTRRLALRYKHTVASLKAELDKFKLQRERYEIRSPVAGTVITRQSEIQQLYSRPVARGESIMEIVPDDSPWDLLVHVPEDEAGELLKAYDALGEGERLEAKIILKVNPDKTFRSEVLSVARRALVLTTGEQKYRNVIEVRVKEPAGLGEVVHPRQGLEGKVAIECGRRSAFYVVTHEFADFVRVSLF